MAMADKYREEYDIMDGARRLFGDTPQYIAMREAMSDMCGKLTQLCTPQPDGNRPVFTEEDNAELRCLQDRVVETCMEYLGGRKPDDLYTRSSYIRYMAAQRVLKSVESDRRKIENIDFSAKMSLREVISRTRGSVETADLDGAKRESGTMSTRIYLPATAERGEGYFSPTIYSESEKVLHHQAIVRVEEDYPPYIPIIRYLARPIRDIPHGIVQQSAERILTGSARAEMEVARDEDTKLFRDYVEPYLDALKKPMATPESRAQAGLPTEHSLEELLEQKEFRNMLFALHDGADYAGNKYHVLRDTGILAGRDLSKRNVAMSVIADHLGHGELLAKSTTMILVDQTSGRKQGGVFMEKGRGLDLNKQNSEPLFFSPGLIWDTPEAKLQLTSMQVLDWICGNTDRHNANMLYDLQKGEDGVVRLMGVQGIDNDNSFGVKSVKELEGSYGSESAGHILPTPETMGVIRRDDAVTVLHLDKKDLNLLLFNLLEPDEIEAAWQRVRSLQKAIMKGDSIRWRDANETRRGVVRVLSDDEVAAMPQIVYAYLPELKRLRAVPRDLENNKTRPIHR